VFYSIASMSQSHLSKKEENFRFEIMETGVNSMKLEMH
jgi:hypothetical protein